MDDEFLSSIDNLYGLIAEDLPLLHDDELICECFCVSVKDIKDCLNDINYVDLNLLTNKLGMGKSCASCLKNAADWKERLF